MKRTAALFFLTCMLFSCGARSDDAMRPVFGIKSGATYRVIIVMDTVDDWSSGIRDGFKENLLKDLTGKGAAAEFTEYDTKLDPKRADEIVAKIKEASPDLICMINYPTVFADAMISSKLIDPKYRIVSENCIPVLSGTINNLEKPGGNVTGVGVFVQMNSILRLAKWLKPSLNRVVFYSWDRVAVLNSWFREELTRACKEENIELVEFREVKHFEDSVELFLKYNNRSDTFLMGGVSAYVDKNGKTLTGREEMKWLRDKLKMPFVCYDETVVKDCAAAGACVIWYDIGAQLAEKGLRILDGENPGDIPWDYPRKYNIILNKKIADSQGIKIPQELLSAAYRIYTDYEGNYIGSGK